MTTDQKLDMLIEAVADIKSNMAAKDELKTELHNLENSLLEEIDTVQEKANTHFDCIESKLDTIESAVKTIKLENSTVNLLISKVSDMQKEIDFLKSKVS